jgi:hypothetical protein
MSSKIAKKTEKYASQGKNCRLKRKATKRTDEVFAALFEFARILKQLKQTAQV